MKRLPVGIQTFRKLIDGNYLYVDKTEDIHRLIVQGSVYFLIITDLGEERYLLDNP